MIESKCVKCHTYGQMRARLKNEGMKGTCFSKGEWNVITSGSDNIIQRQVGGIVMLHINNIFNLTHTIEWYWLGLWTVASIIVGVSLGMMPNQGPLGGSFI